MSIEFSSLIREQEPFLRQLVDTRSALKRHRLLQEASQAQLLALVECCLNVLRGHFPLRPPQKRKLEPHADFIRRLSRARTEKGARSVVQEGGSLTALVGLILPILVELAQSLI